MRIDHWHPTLAEGNREGAGSTSALCPEFRIGLLVVDVEFVPSRSTAVAVMAGRWVIGDLGARVITRLSVDPAANGTAPVSSKFKRLVRCREHRLVIWKRM
jgi:hypothetical protein